MRELERTSASLPSCAVVGRGRLGTVLAAALPGPADGPLGRADAVPADADTVLLCVPDGEIAAAAANVAPRPGLSVGHCSGATTLQPLTDAGHADAFSLHPLMTVPTGALPDVLAGATAAIAGTTEEARATARALAHCLALRPIAVQDADRAAYHAAASVASNFLVTLEGAAEDLALSAGIDRAALVPLVRAAVENWARTGARPALTGPVARGDDATVQRQRDAVSDRCPQHLELFDALTRATRRLAA